jgi:hypothetical protein
MTVADWAPEQLAQAEADEIPRDGPFHRARVRRGALIGGRSAASGGKKVRRIPFPLDRDRSRSALDLCEVIGSQLDVGRAEVLLEPVELGGAGDRHDPRLLRRASRS